MPIDNTTSLDPVMVLAQQRRALYAEHQPISDAYADMLPGDPGHDECDKANREVYARIRAVENQMMALVATTPEGIIEQLDILRDDLAVTAAEAGLDNAIAGLRALSAGGAA